MTDFDLEGSHFILVLWDKASNGVLFIVVDCKSFVCSECLRDTPFRLKLERKRKTKKFVHTFDLGSLVFIGQVSTCCVFITRRFRVQARVGPATSLFFEWPSLYHFIRGLFAHANKKRRTWTSRPTCFRRRSGTRKGPSKELRFTVSRRQTPTSATGEVHEGLRPRTTKRGVRPRRGATEGRGSGTTVRTRGA